MYRIIEGDALASIRSLPHGSARCCVTSPPYWGLRDYGTASWEGGDAGCDHKQLRGGVGEASSKQVSSAGASTTYQYPNVCGKCGALRIDRQLGLERTPEEYVARMVEVFREVRRVLADDGTLWLNLGDSYAANRSYQVSPSKWDSLPQGQSSSVPTGLKPKDLVGIPWRVAFALQADGWWLRQDIIWCLSGGTWLYVRTQKGEMPMTVKDIARLEPSTVELWNGERWTRLLGASKSARRGDELEIVLRSGERVSCTPTHQFPTTVGLTAASDLKVGSVLLGCRLPEPGAPKDCALDEDAAWFAGLYIAEGSRSGDTIQISGHAKETERWSQVLRVASKFGGSATKTEDGNQQSIRVYGKVLNAILDELVAGKTAHDKGFAPVVWRYSNKFLAAMVDGYLSGDGSFDGGRWRLGFCRNYNLERDLRTVCARLGYALTLNLASTDYDGKRVPTFRGELRKSRSGHFNEKDRNEIVEIRKARCRAVYDLGVADEPHLFSLASGVLTHNSKPNPMPESVTDRCTKAHEYMFLLTKSARYYYDAKAVEEPANEANHRKSAGIRRTAPGSAPHGGPRGGERAYVTRNRRSVWTITTKPFKGAHFAVMPEALVEPCILAGSAEGDTVLDPFAGSGTVGVVALRHGRKFVGIELNPEYAHMAKSRINESVPTQMQMEAP